MDVLLIHKLISVVPPEMMAASLEIGKKLNSNPEELVPGGKLIASYSARALSMVICLWEVPNMEALMPPLEQMNMLGWDTDTIPVEKMDVAIPKWEKALQAMQAK
ncbi:hypothetical protein ACFLV5_04865 [Chloroflexota bacterium]